MESRYALKGSNRKSGRQLSTGAAIAYSSADDILRFDQNIPPET
jgi:hypothetical protein